MLKYNVNLKSALWHILGLHRVMKNGFTPFIPKSQLIPDETVYEIKLSYETKTMKGGKAAASLNLFPNYQLF